MERHAMIFAAGLGTRLGVITKTTPKALLTVAGKPLIFHIIWKLYNYGFRHIVINIHHHAELIKSYVETIEFSDLQIQFSDETELLLDTGGGLYAARHFFHNANDILLHNVDILSTIDIDKLWKKHILSQNIATLAVKKRKTERYLLFDQSGFLKGRTNMKTKQEQIYSDDTLTPYAFSGIHIVNNSIFSLMPQQSVYSITNLYLELAQKYNIGKFVHNDDYWVDVGKPEHFEEAERIANLFLKFNLNKK
jgi:MurNAc alpha-1-phosphate uridylyltransferase